MIRPAAILVGALALASCGADDGEVATTAANAADIATACAQPQMLEYSAEVASLADLVEASDVVAEVEVVRRYAVPGQVTDTDGAQTEHLMADLRVTHPIVGATAGEVLPVAVAVVVPVRQDEEVVAGHETDAALGEGQTAIVGLVGPAEGEYGISGGSAGVLLVDDDRATPVCPDRPSGEALAEEVVGADLAAVRAELSALAAAADAPPAGSDAPPGGSETP